MAGKRPVSQSSFLPMAIRQRHCKRVRRRRAKRANTYCLPWWRGILHDLVLCRWKVSDMLEPRMPFGRDLRRIVVMLRKVDPSMTTWSTRGQQAVVRVTLGTYLELHPRGSGSQSTCCRVWPSNLVSLRGGGQCDRRRTGRFQRGRQLWHHRCTASDATIPLCPFCGCFGCTERGTP